MWGEVPSGEDEAYLENAIKFTSDHKLFGKYMVKVIEEWKFSCEHNLSDAAQNRRAWLGQAACALAMKCPEDIVRQAWWKLTDEQKTLANNEADNAIKIWENKYAKDFTENECLRGESGTCKMDF